MSYEAVMEKVRTLPEECLEDASKYLEYLLYQYNLDNPGKMYSPTESEDKSSAKKRRFGSARGKFICPQDFDEDNEEIAGMFGAV